MSGSKGQGGNVATLSLKRTLVRPHEPPKVVNRFFFTAVGNELQLDLGYTDLAQVREAVESQKQGRDAAVELFIFERVAMSPDAVVDLYQTASKMLAHLQKRGLAKNEPEEPSN